MKRAVLKSRQEVWLCRNYTGWYRAFDIGQEFEKKGGVWCSSEDNGMLFCPVDLEGIFPDFRLSRGEGPVRVVFKLEVR